MKKNHNTAVSLWDSTEVKEIVQNLIHSSMKNPEKLNATHKQALGIWGVVSD